MGANEQLIIVNDYPPLTRAQRMLFEEKGHTVIGEANTLNGLRTLIDVHAKDITAAVVGNWIDQYGDGPKAAEIIKDANNNITIVSFAREEIAFGDVNVSEGGPVEELLQAIQNISPKQN